MNITSQDNLGHHFASAIVCCPHGTAIGTDGQSPCWNENDISSSLAEFLIIFITFMLYRVHLCCNFKLSYLPYVILSYMSQRPPFLLKA